MARILIIDDSPTQVKAFSRMLENYGYEILIANSAEDGLAMAQKEIPDLILMDVIMPGMTGYRLVKEVMELAPDIKILLTSGYQVGREQSEMPPELIENLVQKPYGDMKLRRAVRQCLDS